MSAFHWDIAADLLAEIRLPQVIAVLYGRTVVGLQLLSPSVFT